MNIREHTSIRGTLSSFDLGGYATHDEVGLDVPKGSFKGWVMGEVVVVLTATEHDRLISEVERLTGENERLREGK